MSKLLQELSAGLAQTVREAGPGTVRVDARRRLPATGIVWSADGLIVTAHHVVQQDENITVGLEDGSKLNAELVGRDPSTDLALLRVEAADLAPLAPADPATTAVGHLVLALGRPGRTVQATLGIVSALGEGWRTPRGGQVDRYLQTDVVMYPGFSGGPLVAATGELLGLNTSGLSSGVSLAVPTTTLSRVVTALQAHGRVRRGYLGVSTQKVRLPQEIRDQMSQATGLLIVAVEPDSPASAAGLHLGDTIVAFDGQPVADHRELVALLGGERIGNPTGMQVLRGGAVQKITVTIGERP